MRPEGSAPPCLSPPPVRPFLAPPARAAASVAGLCVALLATPLAAFDRGSDGEVIVHAPHIGWHRGSDVEVIYYGPPGYWQRGSDGEVLVAVAFQGVPWIAYAVEDAHRPFVLAVPQAAPGLPEAAPAVVASGPQTFRVETRNGTLRVQDMATGVRLDAVPVAADGIARKGLNPRRFGID